jgi:hypothetical protein
MRIGPYGQEQEILAPVSMAVQPVEIARQDRTASGRKVKDIIAVKNNYQLTYKGLSAASMKIFVNIYKQGEEVSFIYDDSEGEKQVMVYITSLPREIFKRRPDLSQNVSITLEEV